MPSPRLTPPSGKSLIRHCLLRNILIEYCPKLPYGQIIGWCSHLGGWHTPSHWEILDPPSDAILRNHNKNLWKAEYIYTMLYDKKHVFPTDNTLRRDSLIINIGPYYHISAVRRVVVYFLKVVTSSERIWALSLHYVQIWQWMCCHL